ncbi:MAG TPA: hypothetical protein DCW83_03005 [Saprospirales bacterium]|nr:hypothetical protein [Saprospirales bacterium]
MASQLKFNGNTYETHPLYGTKTIKRDVSFNYETTLDKVEFSNGDADLIINADYETEFVLWDGTTRYKFYKNDCVVRRGDRIVTAKVKVVGEYADVKGKLDTEVNIADNKYIKKELTIPYAPMLQFYLGGGSVVSLVNGVLFDTDSLGVNDNAGWYNLANENDDYTNVLIAQSSDSEINGIYIASESVAQNINNGLWTVARITQGYLLTKSLSVNYIALYDGVDDPLFDESTAFSDAFVFINQSDSTDKVLIYSYADPKFRIVTVNEDVLGWTTLLLPEGDLPNNIYTHAVLHSNDSQRELLREWFGMNYGIGLIPSGNTNWTISDEFNAERGNFGVADDQSLLYAGQYFVQTNQSLYPIMSRYWKYGGIYFNLVDGAKDFLNIAQGYQRALFYDFEDVLSEMSGLTINSSFLNGLTPFKNNKKLYLSPLSNLKVRNYDEPATKQILTLSDMFLFLERVYNCYWDIYGGEIRIEHYSFFDDGSSYMGDRVVVDLVNETNSWNGKGIYGDEYAFIKEKSKKNKIWKFQNKHNELYEATVTTTSTYVEDGNENKSVGKMNVDLITILLQDVSNDGVLVIEVDQNDDIIFEDKLINGGLAMTKAIPKYHLYGEGGSSTNYGAAKSRSRLKEETITHSIPLDDVHGLIRTREGNGKIDSVTIDNDGIVVIKLRHDKY